MPTLFALMLRLCGLSQREAAEHFSVRPDTVKAWAQGKRRAPERVLAELAELAARVERAAAEGEREISCLRVRMNAPPECIELGLASDNSEAKSLGWPSTGVHAAVLARIAARAVAAGYRIAIVSRGATAATAAAVDAHEKSVVRR